MDVTLTDAERAELLAGAHLGVLAVAAPPPRPPLATPVWYALGPGGEIVVVTGRDSRKARLLRVAGRASFVVHDPVRPRHAAAEPDVAATADADTVVLRLRPMRWRFIDLAKAAGGG